jgi:glycosyltransferase involved in cell wall biosynthesis
MSRILRILGIRGIPAAHGGFETFAERLAVHLVKKGWQVTVYCQNGRAGSVSEDIWNGVRRVYIPVGRDGAAGSVLFDWKSTLHAAGENGLVLTLGYNTAILSLFYRLKHIRNVINMDGIEWRRRKWGTFAKIWLWLNDWAGCLLGNHLIADHPDIAKHLAKRVRPRKISTICYGADSVYGADKQLLEQFGLEQQRYAIVIARPEPENSVLEIVRAWSQSPKGMKLVLLGRYDCANEYQNSVMKAASGEVLFAGAIYDKKVVNALRFFARLYIHGHQVGGTNPSLVEALGAGNAVLAHANVFNRWVAGSGALYFSDHAECATLLHGLLNDETRLATMREASRIRHLHSFTWNQVLFEYEQLLWAHDRGRVQIEARRDKAYRWI